MKLLLILFCSSPMWAQTPVSRQLPNRPLSDSTSIAQAVPPEFDFYYSAQQAEEFRRMGRASYTRQDLLPRYRFRGKPYTQVVPKGFSLKGPFDDYILIGSGKLDEITPDGQW